MKRSRFGEGGAQDGPGWEKPPGADPSRKPERWTQWVGGAILVFGLGVLILLLSPQWRGRSPPGVRQSAVTGPARVFLVLLNDAGRHGAPAGCGDSLVAYTPPGPVGNDPLGTSVRELLTMPAQPPRPLGAYNALGRSSLRVASVEIGDGVATVALVGQLRAVDACDRSRAQAQLVATITQFPQVRRARIILNGRRLEQIVPLRG